MLQSLALWLIVYNVIISGTQGGRICVSPMCVFVIDIPHKASVSVSVTIKKEHHRKILVLSNISSLFLLCSGRCVQIGSDAGKNDSHSIRVSSDVAA